MDRRSLYDKLMHQLYDTSAFLLSMMSGMTVILIPIHTTGFHDGTDALFMMMMQDNRRQQHHQRCQHQLEYVQSPSHTVSKDTTIFLQSSCKSTFFIAKEESSYKRRCHRALYQELLGEKLAALNYLM